MFLYNRLKPIFNNYKLPKILICFILFELMNLIIVTSYYNMPKSLLGFQISNTSLKSVFAIEGIHINNFTSTYCNKNK